MFTLSLVQMQVTPGNRALNREIARQQVMEAARAGSQLVLLPELFSTGYNLEHAYTDASRPGEGDFRWLAELAKEARLAVAGSVLELDGNQVFNTLVAVTEGGEFLAYYRKIHLFCPMHEERWLAAGNQVVTCAFQGVTLGLATCYDLRFPELFRALACRGAEVLLIPAEWPSSRIEHWRLLLRARAIENQVFSAGVNCCGVSDEALFGGCSAIINPMGSPLVEAGGEPGLITAEIDTRAIQTARRLFSTTREARTDLFPYLSA